MLFRLRFLAPQYVRNSSTRGLSNTGSWVAGIVNPPQIIQISVDVDRRGIDRSVAHQDLDVADVGAAFNEHGSEAMPQEVRGNVLSQCGPSNVADAVINLLPAERFPSPTKKYIWRVQSVGEFRTNVLQILVQDCNGRRAERNDSVLTAFAVPHLGRSIFKIEIPQLEVRKFTFSQSGSKECEKHGLVTN